MTVTIIVSLFTENHYHCFCWVRLKINQRIIGIAIFFLDYLLKQANIQCNFVVATFPIVKVTKFIFESVLK